MGGNPEIRVGYSLTYTYGIGSHRPAVFGPHPSNRASSDSLRAMRALARRV